jgi:hypothetical protein
MTVIPGPGEPISEPDKQLAGEPPAVLVEDLDPEAKPMPPCRAIIY